MNAEMKQRTEKARLYREAYEQGRFDLKMDLLQSLAKLLENDGAGISAKDVMLKIAHIH